MVATKSLIAGAYAMMLTLSACGASLSGRYGTEKDGTDFYFKSGNRVEITVLGSTRVGTYKLEDGKVYVTAANETQAFKFNAKGCIEGGFLFGTLCRK
jgi:hypothetical protein